MAQILLNELHSTGKETENMYECVELDADRARRRNCKKTKCGGVLAFLRRFLESFVLAFEMSNTQQSETSDSDSEKLQDRP